MSSISSFPIKQETVESSWILYSLRTSLGYTDVRNLILMNQIPSSIVPQLELGSTFGSEQINYDALHHYLTTHMATRTKRYFCLTVSNMASSDTGETHYISVWVDHHSKRCFTMDPASKNGRSGIYDSMVQKQVIAPFFIKEGYRVYPVHLTYALQTLKIDVFCQTWSLWLLLQFIPMYLQKCNLPSLSRKDYTMEIPKSLKERSILLYTFYLDLCNLQSLPPVLEEIWTDVQTEHHLSYPKVSICQYLRSKLVPSMILPYHHYTHKKT